MNDETDVTPTTAPEGKITGVPLKGQHALVTGASRGIGAAIAEALARLGCNLTLVARDVGALENQASKIASAHGTTVQSQNADVMNSEEVTTAFESAVAVNGVVSILVNNAGSGKSAPFARMERSLWDYMLAINLTATFVCTQTALPGMLRAGYGRIVNISSTAGLTGYGYVTAYSAAKHGVVGLTRSLAMETAAKGITVNAICPGYTDTEMTRQTIENISAKTGRSAAESRSELTSTNPQGRLVQPWEVAETVAWLALPGSAGITGQAIPIAGGEVM